MSNTFKGFAAGIIAAIFYGTNPLGTLFLYQDEINPTSVLVWRYAIASLLFLAWMVTKRESFHLRLGPAIRMAVLGTFMAMSSATLYLSFKYMDAGIASTILFSYPIITAVLMTAFFHERITWSTTFSILLAVTGIGLLYRGGDNATLSTVGVALVLLSSLFYAFYIIGVNQTHTGLSAIQFTFWVVLFGLISLLVLSVIMGEQIQVLTTSEAMGLCCPVGLAAHGAQPLLHEHRHRESRQYALRHHGCCGVGHGRLHRRAHLRRVLLPAPLLRHCAHPFGRHPAGACQEKRRMSRATRSVLCEPSVADAFSPLVLSAAWAVVVCPALPDHRFCRLGNNAFRAV